METITDIQLKKKSFPRAIKASIMLYRYVILMAVLMTRSKFFSYYLVYTASFK